MSYSTSEPSPAPQDAKVHLLVVEDDVIQRFTLSEFFRLQDYIVYEAATADEAAVLMSSSMVRVDLVITDIWMPGMMDGVDLIGYMRRTFPSMPIIVVSGVYKNMQPMNGTVTFLSKPYNLDELNMHVTKALQAGGAHD